MLKGAVPFQPNEDIRLYIDMLMVHSLEHLSPLDLKYRYEIYAVL